MRVMSRSRDSRLRLLVFVGVHLALGGAVATAFAAAFGKSFHPVAGHLGVVALWDVVLLGILAATVGVVPPARAVWSRVLCALLPAVTLSLQVYLYVLNLVSNLSWGRNITAHLVASFAPTIWAGREPFPIGRVGISVFVLGTLAGWLVSARWWAGPLESSLRTWISPGHAAPGVRARAWLRPVAVTMGALVLLSATVTHAVSSDDLPWKTEFVSSFLRPDGFAFEPTERRRLVAHEDAALRAAYPSSVPGATRRHVVLVIVDSLRADRMEAYGYTRPTTPFLSEMVATGRMQQVAQAFATCPESFCGITSTLSSRTFRDITPTMFHLPDVLRKVGYHTWFLLSGNHEAWNGLPRFYRAEPGTFFDGSMTRRYSIDDDRLVFEGLERVPSAADAGPSFFYVHLMSTHYLGVQLPESHVFTRPDDEVRPGLEPYKMLERLNKPDRYDDKVRQADGLIRRLFTELGAKGYLEDALVVITGDHGEGLGERHWAHGWHLFNEDIHIPLLIYDRPGTRYGNLAFASQVDIAPTILDRLGLPIPGSWEGRSLMRADMKPFSLHQTYFLPNRYAVLLPSAGGGLFKFIATPAYGKEELYDLTADPGETHSVAAEHPELLPALRARVQAYRGDGPY